MARLSFDRELRAPKKQAPRILCCDATRVVGRFTGMKVAALIVAAGRGERAGGGVPKQYQRLLGRPVVSWSVRALAEAGVAPIAIAIAPEHADLCRAATESGPAVRIVAGGETRTASVRAGLAALPEAEIVLIHDAARPGLTPGMVEKLVAAIEAGAGGAAPALAVSDSLRRVDESGRIVGDVEREGVRRVQTPQAFRADVLRAAYAATATNVVFSDDLAIARANGAACVLIPGDPRLMKITYPEDVALLERLMSGERVTCVGTGFDAHRFGPATN